MSYLANLAAIVSPRNRKHTESLAESDAKSSLSSRQHRGPTSPTKRTAKQLRQPVSGYDAALHNIREGKVAKPSHRDKKRNSFWGLALLSSFFNKGDDDDLDGNTLINDDQSSVEMEHEHDTTLNAGEGDSKQDSMVDSYSDYADPRMVVWTSGETWLFTRLQRRGREPLFPVTWYMDFYFFPDRLFTRDLEKVIISETNLTLYRAVRAFGDLCRTPALVRGQITSRATPEKPLLRQITNFYKWSLADGKLNRKAHIPVTAIACAKPKEPTESVVGRVTDQLHDLGRQYRQKWRHPDCKETDEQQIYTHEMPTLFGFVIKYTVVAIVSLDPSVPGKPIRTLHTADWKVKGQDVWNAIAVSLAFIKQRDYLMQLDAEGELGPEIIDDGPDPDA